MKTRCVIIAGGDCNSSLLTKIGDSDYVIAADSGMYHCKAAGILPDLVVGDFDSFSGTLPNTEIVHLPTHKDDTDLLFAARCGVERGFKSFAVFGGYGSRPDQNMAMMQTLVWLAKEIDGADISAVCNGFEIYAVRNGSRCFPRALNRYISVFAVDGCAKGVDITGAEYSLHDAVLTGDFPIGVSNEALNDTTVSVKNGTLLVITVDKNI